jgi:hypothetical protein
MERVTRINSLKMRFLGDKVLQRTAWRVADQLGWETTYDAEFASSERRVKSIPKALPVRRWQARQLQMETANGSPSTSSCSWPQ